MSWPERRIELFVRLRECRKRVWSGAGGSPANCILRGFHGRDVRATNRRSAKTILRDGVFRRPLKKRKSKGVGLPLVGRRFRMKTAACRPAPAPHYLVSIRAEPPAWQRVA